MKILSSSLCFCQFANIQSLLRAEAWGSIANSILSQQVLLALALRADFNHPPAALGARGGCCYMSLGV